MSASKMDIKRLLAKLKGISLPVLAVFVLVLVFQIFLITRCRALYAILFVLTAVLAVSGIAALVRADKKVRNAVLLALLVLVVVRIPFYIHSSGMMLTSDNAMEAIQCRQIAENKTAPFFLLDVARHMGTLAYVWGAFIWNITGVHYLTYEILRLILFAAFLLVLHESFKDVFESRPFVLLLVLNFAFVETMFDTSLSLRGGTYLEMLLFLFLGFSLFDFTFENKFRIFLSYFFSAFAIYFHPLAAVFVAAFFFAAAARALAVRKTLVNALLFPAGVLAGLYHWITFLLTRPPRTDGSGSWEAINIVPLSKISWSWLASFFPKFETVFRNIFRFELSYMVDALKAPPALRSAALGINEVLILISFLVLLTGTFLAFRKIVRILAGKDAFGTEDWISFFHAALFIAAAGKILGLHPLLNEPRHNFEWIVLVILSYFMTASTFLKIGKWVSLKTAAVVVLAVLFTLPHYVCFLKLVEHKEAAYTELLDILDKNNIRYLTTDFMVAYPIHFLSKRGILVSDSLGPFRIREQFREMKAVVDKVPKDEKAYLFYSKDYPSSKWNKDQTVFIKTKLIRELKAQRIPFKTVQLEDYTLVIPNAATRTD